MIKNQVEQRRALARTKEFESQLLQLRSQDERGDPQIGVDSLQEELAMLNEDLRIYDDMLGNQSLPFNLQSLHDLPDLLISARIAKGWPQRRLATELGISEQQIQRYEKGNYRSASLSRLEEVVGALGLTVRAPIELYLGPPPAVTGHADDSNGVHESALSVGATIGSQLSVNAMGRILGQVAHDVNDLAVIIRGYSTIARDLLDETHPLVNDVEKIRKAAEQSSELAGQLLAISGQRSQSGQISDLTSLVQGIERILHLALSGDGTLSIKLDDQRVSVEVDPAEIQGMLVRLISVASGEISASGYVNVEVDSFEVTNAANLSWTGLAPGRYAMLRIVVEGVEQCDGPLSEIYREFAVVSPEPGATRGTIGSILRRIRSQGGYCRGDWDSNKTWTFTIALPQADGCAPSITGQPRMLLPDRRVLLVDDTKDLSRLVARRLSTMGYTVTAVRDGRSALESLEEPESGIGVVVTDIMMPGMTGIELASKIRESRPDMPIIFWSSVFRGNLPEEATPGEEETLIYKPSWGQTLLPRLELVFSEPSRRCLQEDQLEAGR